MSASFTVWFAYDDRRATKSRCQTDHALDKGDTIYAKQGRATVICCRENRATDATFLGMNARALASISSTTGA